MEQDIPDPSLLDRVCRLAHDRLGRSLTKRIQESGVLEAPEVLQAAAIEGHLRKHPALVDAWRNYCADKRCASGWSIQEGMFGKNFTVGHFAVVSGHGDPRCVQTEAKTFSDPFAACAAFIVNELNEVVDGMKNRPEGVTVASMIERALRRGSDRPQKAVLLAEFIKVYGAYNWVGVYDVGKENVSIIARNGRSTRDHSVLPITVGPIGAAIQQKSTVVERDVRQDNSYLSAFGTTLSQAVIPVLDAEHGAVIGIINVESDRRDAFGDSDRRMLEQCAVAAFPLWVA